MYTIRTNSRICNSYDKGIDSILICYFGSTDINIHSNCIVLDIDFIYFHTDYFSYH